MRKKLLPILLTLLFAFVLTGCDSNGDIDTHDNNKPNEQEDAKETIAMSSAVIENGNLILIMSDGSKINVGRVQGEKGDKGEQGEQGIQGEKGERGEQGIPGEKGDKGEQGEQGTPGEKGDKGEQGEQGTPGEKGDKGEQGEQGTPGEKGDKGEQGIPGEKGDKGEQGEQGKTGEKGDKGEQGIPGEKGDKGDKGEQGLKGDKGDKGDNGSDGSSSTSLTTGNFQSGVVTNSVTSSSTDSQIPTAKSVFDGLSRKLDSNLGTTNVGKYLKVNSDGSVITASIPAISIADDLTTDDNTKVLSAKQGKLLNDTKANIADTYSKTEVDALLEAFFSVLYPVGSQYTSYDKDFDPNNATGWNGTWVKIEEGYFIEATVNPDSVGTKKEAGLPNINGFFEIQRSYYTYWVIDATNGSFSSALTGGSTTGNINNGDYNNLPRQKISFDASLSSPIYGRSATVQPKSILAYIWKRVD